MNNGNGTKPIAIPEREKQILNELGFDAKPAVQPTSVKPVAPVISGNSGNIGNFASAKPAEKRANSWSANVVLAVVDHHLAKTAGEAVALLNQTGLNVKSSPQEAVAEIKKMLGK